MNKLKEGKILEELRRRGTIFEDPCPKSENFIGKLIDIFLKRNKKIVRCIAINNELHIK